MSRNPNNRDAIISRLFVASVDATDPVEKRQKLLQMVLFLFATDHRIKNLVERLKR